MCGETSRDRLRLRLDGRSRQLERRTHAIRPDLADIALADRLFAPHYARAIEMRCAVPGAMILDDNKSVAVSQLLHGESFHVLDVTGDWAWGYCGHDHYVGYLLRVQLAPAPLAPTHQVTALAAPLFSEPDIKSAVGGYLPIGALVAGEATDAFLAVADGYLHMRHLAGVDEPAADWVAAACAYRGLPYVWGGRGHGGVDCSGLVQAALAHAGIAAPRDSDMQLEALGTELPADAPLRRGDLLFFPGHVGIMTDADMMLHANAHWMAVVTEPLADVIARLSTEHAQPVLARRRLTA